MVIVGKNCNNDPLIKFDLMPFPGLHGGENEGCRGQRQSNLADQQKNTVRRNQTTVLRFDDYIYIYIPIMCTCFFLRIRPLAYQNPSRSWGVSAVITEQGISDDISKAKWTDRGVKKCSCLQVSPWVKNDKTIVGIYVSILVGTYL